MKQLKVEHLEGERIIKVNVCDCVLCTLADYEEPEERE